METNDVKLTDLIRADLMDYIYSDNLVEDANYLYTILSNLTAIDMELDSLIDEATDYKERWKRAFRAKLELERKCNELEKKLEEIQKAAST